LSIRHTDANTDALIQMANQWFSVEVPTSTT